MPADRTAAVAPESTAARVALWRALHVAVDPPPHVLEDEVGLQLLAPGAGWRDRGDMDPRGTAGFRASIVGRARLLEDLVANEVERGVGQYVILGAGLDSFAQRRPELGTRLTVFEVDQPGPQAWKQQRLGELGLGIPPWLRFAPVDFEAGDPWWDQLVRAGFDAGAPAVIASTGVVMYLTHDAIMAMLRSIAALAPGSTLALTYLVPSELTEPAERPVQEAVERAARASGTPFLSLIAPADMIALAREAGFRDAREGSVAELGARHFAGRPDGLRPASAEHLLIATT
jgi:methyltransferase (TIGR00027 family)